MTELDQHNAEEIVRAWQESFDIATLLGEPCLTRGANVRRGYNAFLCLFRLKRMPIYLLQWQHRKQVKVETGQLEEILKGPYERLELPDNTVVTDHEFLWLYLNDECCIGCHHTMLETPAFRVSPKYSGPLPWKESRETGWFRADGDPQPAIAVSYYSIPEELRPSNY